MKKETALYRALAGNRVGINELRTPADNYREAIYIDKANTLAETLGVDDYPFSLTQLPPDDVEITPDKLLPALYGLEKFMNALYAKNLFEIDCSFGDFVQLDNDW